MDEIRWVCLSEISELITKGTTPTTIGYEFQESGINFLKIECFDEDGMFIDSKVAHISGECNKQLRRSQLKAGDILFSIAGAIGRVAIVTEKMLPANTNQALAIIRITRNDVYLPYVKLILTSPLIKKQFEHKKQGVAQLNISLKNINDLKIPLPGIQQQIALSELFDKINKVINARKEQLRTLDTLIKARFVEMFSSIEEEKLLEDISEFVTVGIANSATHAYAESGIPMLRNQNIKENYLDDTDLIFIKPEFAAKYESKKLKENDIIAMRTGYPGVACLVPKKYEGCQTFTTLIVRLKADNNPSYVCSYINSDLGKRFIESGKVGVAQQNFGAKSLAKMPIKIAPKGLQDEYAHFVNQVDKSKVVVQEALVEARMLFDSLMQKYFG